MGKKGYFLLCCPCPGPQTAPLYIHSVCVSLRCFDFVGSLWGAGYPSPPGETGPPGGKGARGLVRPCAIATANQDTIYKEGGRGRQM